MGRLGEQQAAPAAALVLGRAAPQQAGQGVAEAAAPARQLGFVVGFELGLVVELGVLVEPASPGSASVSGVSSPSASEPSPASVISAAGLGSGWVVGARIAWPRYCAE